MAPDALANSVRRGWNGLGGGVPFDGLPSMTPASTPDVGIEGIMKQPMDEHQAGPRPRTSDIHAASPHKRRHDVIDDDENESDTEQVGVILDLHDVVDGDHDEHDEHDEARSGCGLKRYRHLMKDSSKRIRNESIAGLEERWGTDWRTWVPDGVVHRSSDLDGIGSKGHSEPLPPRDWGGPVLLEMLKLSKSGADGVVIHGLISEVVAERLSEYRGRGHKSVTRWVTAKDLMEVMERLGATVEAEPGHVRGTRSRPKRGRPNVENSLLQAEPLHGPVSSANTYTPARDLATPASMDSASTATEQVVSHEQDAKVVQIAAPTRTVLPRDPDTPATGIAAASSTRHTSQYAFTARQEGKQPISSFAERKRTAELRKEIAQANLELLLLEKEEREEREQRRLALLHGKGSKDDPIIF